MKDGCIMCDFLMCEGMRGTEQREEPQYLNEVKGLVTNMSNMPKVYHCQKCGKEIGNLECYESAKILRKRVPSGDPKIFDVWFMDYCNDCASTIDIEKEFGKKSDNI